MYPNYLAIFFDEAKDPVPSNALWQYMEKKQWQTLQADLCKEIEMGENKYMITRRRSFEMGDFTGKTMILVLDIILKQ